MFAAKKDIYFLNFSRTPNPRFCWRIDEFLGWKANIHEKNQIIFVFQRECQIFYLLFIFFFLTIFNLFFNFIGNVRFFIFSLFLSFFFWGRYDQFWGGIWPTVLLVIIPNYKLRKRVYTHTENYGFYRSRFYCVRIYQNSRELFPQQLTMCYIIITVIRQKYFLRKSVYKDRKR